MNDTVPEGNRLIFRMIILGVVAGVIGSFMVDAPFVYIKGILFGTIFSILRLKLMEISIRKSVQMHEIKAQRYAVGGYLSRYILTGIILFIAALEPSISLLGTVLGILSMKVAAFMSIHRNKRNSLKTIENNNTSDMK